MKPLSERLEEIATHYDGDCCDSCDAKIISAIREGAQLAKRYEDAPVAHMCGECEHTWMRHVDTDTSAQDAALAGMCGQRVRIVLDKEG